MPSLYLTLTLKRATGLKKTDWWSESDPYVTFRLFEGRKKIAEMKSTVLMNAKDPVWSQGNGQTQSFVPQNSQPTLLPTRLPV
jgi:Ca2+-dependent lipid-binding protein